MTEVGVSMAVYDDDLGHSSCNSAALIATSYFDAVVSHFYLFHANMFRMTLHAETVAIGCSWSSYSVVYLSPSVNRLAEIAEPKQAG